MEESPKGKMPLKGRRKTLERPGRPNDQYTVPVTGRNPDLTPDVAEKIIKAIRIGASVASAGAFGGVAYDTLRTWALRAREFPDSIYAEFLVDVMQAVSECEVRDLSTIELFLKGRPAEYAYNTVTDANGKETKTLAHDSKGNLVVTRSEVKPDWRAAAWRLERRMPRQWGPGDININLIKGQGEIEVAEQTKDVGEEESTKDFLQKFKDEYF